ncbi:MAG TPA: tRNA lysidine(34) synthetase TilS [Candidatus Acidoferrales bacterium]|nr:tRNA lysidine(34) synthetase TilS [Candidatus Acidoferrales bacterium]
MRAGDRVGVAVSGGLDSVALLRLLLELRAELGIVVLAVHFNHKLRAAESAADQEFVANLAGEYGLEFYADSGDVAGLAADAHSGVEAAARELRYRFFQRLLGSGSAEDLATAGAKAQDLESLSRSLESAALPKSIPQGLRPAPLDNIRGASETTPFPSSGRRIEEAPAQILNKIATGHTLDDQAETVLLRLVRGTGLRGLGAIYPRIVVEYEDGDGRGEIVRPLLGVRRRELEKYLTDLKQSWREDSSNTDSKFTRNRVRSLVLPLLEREFNPAVVETFSELAEIARDEEDYWDNEVSGWLGTVVQWSEPEWLRGLPGFGAAQSLVRIGQPQPEVDPQALARIEQWGAPLMNASVSRPWLLTEPRAVQRRVLKAIGEQVGIPLGFRHIEEIMQFAAEDGAAGKALSLPLGWKTVREREAILFVAPDLSRNEPVLNYEYSLPVPGRAVVPEVGGVIEALRIRPGVQIAEYNPQQLLRADLLPERLIMRNWRPGDRFWPAHTKSPKKVKELLQERRIAQAQRRFWPVAVSGEEIIWMRGFPVPAGLLATEGHEAVLIRESPWAVDDGTI